MLRFHLLEQGLRVFLHPFLLVLHVLNRLLCCLESLLVGIFVLNQIELTHRRLHAVPEVAAVLDLEPPQISTEEPG